MMPLCVSRWKSVCTFEVSLLTTTLEMRRSCQVPPMRSGVPPAVEMGISDELEEMKE